MVPPYQLSEILTHEFSEKTGFLLHLDIQYGTDTQGNRIFVQIPVDQWEMIHPNVIHEDKTGEISESPVVIDKDGILVVRGELFQDLTDITRNERKRRVSELVQRAGV